MALSIPPGFAEASIVFRHSLDPDPWAITFGIHPDTGDPAESQQAICDAVGEAWVNNCLGIMASAVLVVEARCTFGGGPPDPDPLTLVSPLNNQCTKSGAMLPQNCATLVTKVSSTGGKKGKGRFFLPACLEEGRVSDVGVIDGDLVATLQGKMDDFLTDLETAGPDGSPPIRMAILHVNESDNPPAEVRKLIVGNTISTQRRRLR